VWLLRPNRTVVCWTLGMPTSLKMEAHVVHVEIPLLPLPRADGIHLSINGVDEVDPDLSLSRAAAARSSRSRWSSAGPGRWPRGLAAQTTSTSALEETHPHKKNKKKPSLIRVNDQPMLNESLLIEHNTI
jgi:hypothetical protein